MTATARALLVVAIGVSLFGCGQSTDVRFRAFFSSLAGSELSAEMTAGGRMVRVSRPDFTATSRVGGAVTRFVSVGTDRVSVRVTLRDDRGKVGEARLTFQPTDGWGHDVVIVVAGADPTEGCFGCALAMPFPLDPRLHAAPADSLWVYLTLDPRDPNVVF